jgi:hypothetical protein
MLVPAWHWLSTQRASTELFYFLYQEHLDLASWVLETDHHNCSHFVTSCKLDSRWVLLCDLNEIIDR